MSILSAESIRERCERQSLVTPFHERTELVWSDSDDNPQHRWRSLSRIREEAADSVERRPTDSQLSRLVLPRLSFGLSACGYDVRIDQDLWVWPLAGRLASTVEHFQMPVDLMAQVTDKSSWARRFLTVQNTVIEPGWRGYLTLELTNHSLWPIRIRRGAPIAQILFMQLDRPTAPYLGKYLDQPPRPVKAI